ncbi:MAG: hypothetical protein LBQ46_14010 [Treponema sp.]|jgi:hypothetical protein|nr:hypothetical protein [Treponema sp.]
MKKATSVVVLLCAATVIFAAGCSSVRSGAREGARDGVSDGISGLFRSGGSGGSGGTAPERNYSGSSQTVPWPSDTEWGRYGLSGLRQPPGTDVTAPALVNEGA